MMRITVFGTLLFWIPLCISAQIVEVTGSEQGAPLELVTIASEEPRASAITNARGQADITPFRGARVIEFRRIGYNPQYLSFGQLEAMEFRLQLSRVRVNLDEVVISATRWTQKTSEIPMKVTAISPSAFRLQNPQTAADMLGISGKVFIQKSQQGGGSPMIRGFATSRLLYAVDGVRMNTAIFRGGNIQNVISLDPFAMEKTEILFGPGSVIYGSDAIGGVMSFRTLTPQFSYEDRLLVSGKVVGRFASANLERTGHADLNIGGKKWAGVTSVTTSDYGDLRMGSNGPDDYRRLHYVERIDGVDVVKANEDPNLQRPSGYRQLNLMQKIHFKPGTRWDFQYGFHYSTTSDYARYDRHLRERDGQPRYAEWNYGPQQWMMNHLEITHSARQPLYDLATLRLAWQRFGESRITRDLDAEWRDQRMERVDALSANLDFSRETGRGNGLYYGLEVVWNGVESTGSRENILTGAKENAPSRYPSSDWASYAIYVTDQYKATDRLTLQGGVRYSRYLLTASFDTRFYPLPFTSTRIHNGALTGSAGLVYRPGEDWVISTNLSTAFRSPNVDDVGKVFDSEPGSVTVPNPGLRAEYAYNADMGIAKVINGLVKIDLTGYYTYLRNALVRRDFLLDGRDSIYYDGELSRVQAIQNAAMAHVYGIQAGLEVKMPSGFGFTSDLNWQRGVEEMDDGSRSPTRHAAPWFGVSRIHYTRKPFEVQIYTVYNGEKPYDELPEEEKGKTEIYAADPLGNPYSPSWATLNLKAAVQLPGGVTFSGGVENITDQRYRPYGSGIAAPGRNYLLSFRLQF